MSIHTKKYFDESDKLLYDGEIYNKKYHGIGKLYFPNGNLEYEGDFINNNFHGNGNLYYIDGNLRYVGEFINNKAHGNGKVYNNDGSIIYVGNFHRHTWYEGEISESLPHGKGKLYFVDMEYAGFNCYNLSWLYFRNIGLRYEGMFKEGKYDGEGVLFIKDYDFKYYKKHYNIYLGYWELL